MKKFLLEYVNLIAYILTGLVFSVAAFLIFINFYHYKEVNEVYDKGENYEEGYKNYSNKLESIKNNLSVNANSYNGPADKLSVMGIKSRLDICVSKYENDEIKEILQKKEINVQDTYKLLDIYQSTIVNDCVVLQLYSMDATSVPSFNTIKPFIDHESKMLISDLDFIKKVLQNNSTYQFTSEYDKVNIFNLTRDSYSNVIASYNNSLEFVETMSEWYKKVVAGEV